MDTGMFNHPGQSPFSGVLLALRVRQFAIALALAAVFMAFPLRAETIVSCGFEPSGDTWAYTPSSGKINTDDGAGDSPEGQRILGGKQSWLVTNTASTLLFSDVLLSGWTNVTVNYHVSSTAISNGRGNAAFDRVETTVTAAYAGQNSRSTVKTLTGAGSGTAWGYDDARSLVHVGVDAGASSLALKIYAKNESWKSCWNIDDVAVEGTRTTSNNVWWNGAGDWDNSTANKCWTTNSAGGACYAWNVVNGDNAHFGLPGKVLKLGDGATVGVRSLTFAADGCAIAAGDSVSKLALTNGGSGGAGANTIEVTTAAHTATINATIVGNTGVGLTKTGEGTLVLGAANTFTGITSVQDGTLKLTSSAALAGSSAIDVAAGTALDVSVIAGGYRLGADGRQILSGSGRIVGSLTIEDGGVHNLGNSPGVQEVQGRYVMSGLLETDVCGAAPGNGTVGYDQVLVSGETSFGVVLSGSLSVAWGGAGWSSAGDRLWILRNDTAGTLSGTFLGYTNGAVVGAYDGRSWRIYYGADANTGQFSGGNDVLLTAAAPVPEPRSLVLGLLGGIVMGLAHRRLFWRWKSQG